MSPDPDEDDPLRRIASLKRDFGVIELQWPPDAGAPDDVVAVVYARDHATGSPPALFLRPSVSYAHASALLAEVQRLLRADAVDDERVFTHTDGVTGRRLSVIHLWTLAGPAAP